LFHFNTSQCEKEYHIGCLRENSIADLKDLPDNWFCTEDCGTLNTCLNDLIKRGPLKVPQYYMDIIKKKMKESAEDSIANLDVNWILLRGKAASEEDKAQLKDAVDIFHNLFKPIIDPVTRSDFIESMAYGMEMGGSTMNGSDFSGVYCALLTINSKAVTAGLFRVFGRNIAELSIVATSKSYQRKVCALFLSNFLY
nr:increased DNA methylation 1-like [Tanacetum cinerariifolium]